MRLTLNGQVMQDATTDDLAFDVPALLSYASSVAILQPGDLLITGSPAGNGSHWKRFLHRRRPRRVDDLRPRNPAQPRAQSERRASPVAGRPSVTLRQSQFVPPVPLIVAGECGLLDGIDLEAHRTTGSPQQLAGLRAGDIDIAVTAIDNLYRVDGCRSRRAARRPDRSHDAAGHLARTRPSMTSPISRASRFAVDAATNGFSLVARYLLEREGVTVEYVEVGGVKERLDALLAGEVAATLLGPPFDAMAQDASASLLTTVAETLPAFPGQGLVVAVRAPRLGRARRLPARASFGRGCR